MELATLITVALIVLLLALFSAMGWSRHQHAITQRQAEKLRVLSQNYRLFLSISQQLSDPFISPPLRSWLATNMSSILDEMKRLDRKNSRFYREDFDAIRVFSQQSSLTEREKSEAMGEIGTEEANQARAQLKRCVALAKAMYERDQLEADEFRALINEVRSILTLTAADFYLAKAESAQAKKDYRRALACWQKYRDVLRQHHSPGQQIVLRLQVADQRISRIRKELKTERAEKQRESTTLDKQIASFTEEDNWKKASLYDER